MNLCYNYLMKIINNTNINDLILYSKKNLGIYKLVYKEEKKKYYMSIIFVFISILFLITYILFSLYITNVILERLCCFCCLITCLYSLWLIKYVEKKTKNKHLEIQDVRFGLLKNYYNDNNLGYKELKIINQQLEKRIEKIEKQKITILIVLSIMIMPLWDLFVQEYFKEISFNRVIKFSFFLIIFSVIILVIIRFFNKTLYLYEENFYIKNNISLIENLIYLNNYIIQEKEEQINNGRRGR